MKLTFPKHEKVHCLDLSSGDSTTGNIEITDSDITLKLYRYGEDFDVDNLNPIYLHTEQNYNISLYGVTPSYSQCNPLIPDTVYKKKIEANYAIVGYNKWTWKDTVKVSRFTIPYLKEIFEDTKEYKQIARANQSAPPNTQIFSISTESVRIRGDCEVSWQGRDEYPRHIDPYLEIEFPKGVNLIEQRISNNYLSSFWSLLLGYPVQPREVAISNLTQADLTRANNKACAESRQFKNLYLVFYSNSERMPQRIDSKPENYFGIHMLKEIKLCLKQWMIRQNTWEPPSKLMVVSLCYSTEHSVDRLLTAFRWFEKLPCISSEQTINDRDIKIIAIAATIEAEKLGYTNEVNNRIKGSIKSIRNETSKERFERLTQKIKEKFDDFPLNEQFVTDLCYASKYRNDAAHGLFKFDNQQEYHNAYRGMLAMEILCLLLTLFELPLSKNSKQRFARYQRIDYYKQLPVDA